MLFLEKNGCDFMRIYIFLMGKMITHKMDCILAKGISVSDRQILLTNDLISF